MATQRLGLEWELNQIKQQIANTEYWIIAGNWVGYTEALQIRKQRLKAYKAIKDSLIIEIEILKGENINLHKVNKDIFGEVIPI
ncbi:MAG: hypothetical protein WBO70_07585 [Erysipelotrichaceae bacterium]